MMEIHLIFTSSNQLKMSIANNLNQHLGLKICFSLVYSIESVDGGTITKKVGRYYEILFEKSEIFITLQKTKIGSYNLSCGPEGLFLIDDANKKLECFIHPLIFENPVPRVQYTEYQEKILQPVIPLPFSSQLKQQFIKITNLKFKIQSQEQDFFKNIKNITEVSNINFNTENGYEIVFLNQENKPLFLIKNINGDLLDRDTCLKAFRSRPDIVIHLATYPRAKIVDQDPINGIPKVIGTTTNLLWHASKFETKKFVYISSSMVYGDFVDGTKEDANTKPKNIYGEAKLTGERMVKLFAKRDGLNYNIIRPSGVYGPGDMPDRVVSKFFEKAMSNKTITLHNGENKVDFTYRQDAARGIILAALSSVANVSFNITAGNATSLRTLAEKIIEITGSDSDIEDIGNHKLYPMRGTLDISRAKDLLDYAPEFTLEQGLKSYYDWLQNKI